MKKRIVFELAAGILMLVSALYTYPELFMINHSIVAKTA